MILVTSTSVVLVTVAVVSSKICVMCTSMNSTTITNVSGPATITAEICGLTPACVNPAQHHLAPYVYDSLQLLHQKAVGGCRELHHALILLQYLKVSCHKSNTAISEPNQVKPFD